MLLKFAKTTAKALFPETVWHMPSHLSWRLWDAWHGVETSGLAEVESLDLESRNRAFAVRYEPSRSVRSTLLELGLDYKNYGFVDFGSGKGRVLLFASEHPFKFVEGVELSPLLHAISETNIRRYRFATVRCGRVRSNLVDATEYQLPNEPLVLYFFNPFRGPVLAAVVENIRRSVEAHQRDIVIVLVGKWTDPAAFASLPNIQQYKTLSHGVALRTNGVRNGSSGEDN